MVKLIAWHFTGNTLRYGRPIPPVGEWLVHDGPVLIRKSGLHASVKALDALDYALGSMAHLVECEGVVEMQSDKLVCRRRRILASVDAAGILRAFARRQALSVIHLWDAPDVVRRYLETGDESIRVAARDAAWAAASAAASAAESNAAWAAASAAAGAAAWDAAWAAARDAAWDAAWAAARAAANEQLEAMLLAAMGSKHPDVLRAAGK